MRRVKIDNRGIVYGIAFCESCNWTDDLKIELKQPNEALRMSAKRHCQNTGHTTVIKIGTTRIYSAED